MVNKKISTRFFSKQQENSVAKTITGKTVANSGARPYQKGDVSTSGDKTGTTVAADSWLIECKTSTTPKQSFAIKKQWLETIKEEAFQAGKMNYAVAFSFGPKQENYYILSEDKFKQLFGEE
jgi:hypothetical protein